MSCCNIRILPGKSIDEERLRACVSKICENLNNSSSRRQEINGFSYDVESTFSDEAEIRAFVGCPKALWNTLRDVKQPKSVFVLLPDGEWGEAVANLVEHPFISVEVILRVSHLGMAEEATNDPEECAAFEKALLGVLRKELRRDAREEVFSKPIEWKAKLPAGLSREQTLGSHAAIFSFFSDPAMAELLWSTKAAIRDLTQRQGKNKISVVESIKNSRILEEKSGSGNKMLDSYTSVEWKGLFSPSFFCTPLFD